MSGAEGDITINKMGLKEFIVCSLLGNLPPTASEWSILRAFQWLGCDECQSMRCERNRSGQSALGPGAMMGSRKYIPVGSPGRPSSRIPTHPDASSGAHDRLERLQPRAATSVRLRLLQLTTSLLAFIHFSLACGRTLFAFFTGVYPGTLSGGPSES